MAKNNRHNAAFVVGSVVGAVAGAAAALWKTPYTGEELRAKVTASNSQSQTQEPGMVVASPQPGVAMNTRTGERSLKDKVLSGVEKTLAPIVGVELGKTANGSGAAAGSDIKVNADYAGTISNRRAWQGDSSSTSTSTTTSSDGTPTLGLSRDKVDAEKWAAAYSGETTVPTTTPSATNTSTTAASTPTPSATTTSATGQDASGDAAWSKKRRAWNSDSGSAGASTTSPAEGTPTLGLSRDKVNADEWAAAYSGETTTSTTTPDTARSSSDRAATSAPANAAQESSSKTGQGADPAYPGQEFPGHAPADRAAPESNVAPAPRQNQGGNARTVDHSTADAATITQLTTPQTDRIPDSLRQPTERSTHPFPKLGGKE